MANTIMTAKNSFQEGLIMDFSPDNTQATCMTSALNATLVTFNGNEMQLLNDMGNGRVETAYLPEGYIPVGTCEFGDIIYIVSYNPITDLSQIGCFPSPERNISSEEIYYNSGGYLKLDYSEFLEKDYNNKPTGILKDTSIKKVLIDSKKLNPGDKYIIYTTPTGLSSNKNCLSDLAEDKIHGNNPKYLKLHIVSIDDNGKITYLDSTTKWYDTVDGNSYYIDSLANKNVNGNIVPDIDSYRNLLLSGWSIFSSKVSGKLAILAELETIDTFSCSYELETLESTLEGNYLYKNYKIKIIPEWESNKGIDPSYIMITRSQFNNTYVTNNEKGEQIICNYPYLATNEVSSSNERGFLLSDRDSEGYITIGKVSIPYKKQIGNEWIEIKSPSFVYTVDITPAMNFGRLDYLTSTLEIDFNSVGTGDVFLTGWKYHNSGTTSILLYDINVYPKPEHEVNNITIQFFDNIGLVGEYKLEGKKSYSGTHIEHFGLDGEAYNSRFSRKNSYATKEDEEIIKHPGTKVDGINKEDIKGNDAYCVYNNEVYTNDARTLYSGYLYLAKITVNQKHKKASALEPYTIYRWYWTNSMFNEYFYQVKDFKKLDFELVLNGEAIFESASSFQWKLKELNNLAIPFEENQNWKTYSANAQYIGREGTGNINMYVNAGLQNNYNCFNLNKDSLNTIDLEVWLASAKMSYGLPDLLYEFSDKQTSVSGTGANFLALNSLTINDGFESIGDKFNYLDTPSNIAVENSQLSDGFNIYFFGSSGKSTDENNNLDANEDGIKEIKAPYLKTSLGQCYYMNDSYKLPILLSMLAILFNKAYVQDVYSTSVQVPVYTPIINSLEDLSALGIAHKESNGKVSLAFNSGMCISLSSSYFSGTDFLFSNDDKGMRFTNAYTDDKNYKIDEGVSRIINVSNDPGFIETVWGNISSRMGLFFPVYLGGKPNTDRYNAINGSASSAANTENWQKKRAHTLNSLNIDAKLKTSLLTEGVFDVLGDGTFNNINEKTATSFLGMKYKEGMTVFNSAFMDSTNDGKDFRLVDSVTGYYDNFAYLLYLILSNTYHKDKRLEDTEIDIKNYVRNGNYTVELLKNVIIRLSQNSIHNILVKGIPLSTILEGFRDKLPSSGTKEENLPGSSNTTLKLLQYAKNHELKVQVKSLPMSFLNTNIDSFIMRNGILSPSKGLANTFYIYQDGLLLLYANRILTFPLEEVTANLQYLLNSSTTNYTLAGARTETLDRYLTDWQKAYNLYIDYIKQYAIRKYTITYHSTEEAAIQSRERFISNMIYDALENAYGYSKEAIFLYIRLLEFFNRLFDIYYDEINLLYRFVIQPHVLDEPFVKYDPKEVKANYYKIDCNLSLNSFKYENGLMLNPSTSFSTFGMRDNIGLNYTSGYGGFIRNIVIDTNYQVVQK